MDKDRMLKEITGLALKAGEIITGDEDVSVTSKTSRRDLVTTRDTEIQLMLMRELSALAPGCIFLCEEDVAAEGVRTAADPEDISDGVCYIIDPIDGTANFVHGIGHSCTSIAMLENGETVIGVIYDPYRDEMFHAVKGRGPYLNDELISVEDSGIAAAVTVFGTAPYDDSTNGPTFDLGELLYEISSDVRRTGSAALDLCWTACGRFGLYAELSLSPWDFAAGKLIAEEAGCIVTDIDGKPLEFSGKPSILCGRPKGIQRFMKEFKRPL